MRDNGAPNLFCGRLRMHGELMFWVLIDKIRNVDGVQAIFHAVSLTCVCVNALHLPYRRGSDIIHRLRRDNLLAYAVRISVSS